jgi:ferredoxin
VHQLREMRGGLPDRGHALGPLRAADYIVACNSTDKGALVRKYCKVGCIACKICEKKSPEGGYKVEDNLSRIDYRSGDRRAGRGRLSHQMHHTERAARAEKMKSIQLVFGTHNHQSEGDHPERYEEVYQAAYKPFLSVLNSYPGLPAVLYYSGPLLEWMEESHPEFLMLLDEMVRRRQVELLGGGFYEPILTMLPTSDRLGQMEKMTTYLRTRFGTRPRGCWLAHQVWEPNLVLSLRNSGMDFTFLEDQFFRNGGPGGDGLHIPT